MDIFELSNRLDVKLNSFSSFADTKTNENLYNIKLDEYEKSLLLTEAQNTIFKAIYLSGSETDESARKALSKLLRVTKCDQLSTNQTNLDNSKRFKLPLDVAFINQENVKVLSIGTYLSNKFIPVVPIKHDEYNRDYKNPFRIKLDNEAYRIESQYSSGDTVEIISKYNIEYWIRYYKIPNPIILEYLGNVEIGGKNSPQEIEFNDIILEEILNKAVELAVNRIGASNRQSEAQQ